MSWSYSVILLTLNYMLGVSVSIETVSSSCYITMEDCQKLVARINQQPIMDACKLMTAEYRSVTAYHCLVKIGLCTDSEYSVLKTLVCQESPEVQSALTLAKLKLYREVNLAPITCQEQILTCIRRYITAIVLKQEEHFCALMNLDINGVTSKSCLVDDGHCSIEDYTRINEASCDQVLLGKELTLFVQSIQSTTSQCKHTIEQCYSQSQNVRILINSEQYCQMMNVMENSTSTLQCLVEQGKCSEEEFKNMKESACSSGSIIYVLWSICYILVIISYFS